jgi:hypothetical protein
MARSGRSLSARGGWTRRGCGGVCSQGRGRWQAAALQANKERCCTPAMAAVLAGCRSRAFLLQQRGRAGAYVGLLLEAARGATAASRRFRTTRTQGSRAGLKEARESSFSGETNKNVGSRYRANASGRQTTRVRAKRRREWLASVFVECDARSSDRQRGSG